MPGFHAVTGPGLTSPVRLLSGSCAIAGLGGCSSLTELTRDGDVVVRAHDAGRREDLAGLARLVVLRRAYHHGRCHGAVARLAGAAAVHAAVLWGRQAVSR